MTIEILEILKNFIEENDLGPTKTFYAGDKPKREYSELEKSRFKSLKNICENFINNKIIAKNLAEEIKKDLDISDELVIDIAKKIENIDKNSLKKNTEEKEPSPKNNDNENKKSLFSVLVNEKK
jgi:hypothetical protein